ncbi:MAG: YceI family protein [Xanthomonadaceae bacterium]|nr:YceI family protein [Xanthomonadaceae bacterium]
MRYCFLALTLLVSALAIPAPASAEREHYVIDTRGAHAFIQFRIPHMGFSWLYGRFNDFEGEFVYDSQDPSKSSVNVTVQTEPPASPST